MSDSPFWNEDWMKVQKQYWDQLSAMANQAQSTSQQGFGQGFGQAFSQQANNPWANNSWTNNNWEGAMQHWLQAVMPNQNHQSYDFMQKMIEQGKMFFQMGEKLAANLQNTSDWNQALEKTFEQLTQSFNSFANMSGDPSSQMPGMEQLAGFWSSPVENWQKVVGGMDFSQFQNPNFSQMGDAFNPLEKILGTPSLGYSRESDDLNKQFMQATADYQKAFMAYNSFFADIGISSVNIMKDKISKLQKSEKTIDSAKGLYDLWVAVCEEYYAERVMTEEYSKLHGELVNSLMKCKKLWGEIMDNFLSQMNMPTQKEMKTLQGRLQQSRRDVRSLNRSMNDLKKEVELLKANQQKAESSAKAPVAQTSSAKAETQKAAPAAKKAVAKKKTTRKKAPAKATTAKTATKTANDKTE